MVQNAGSQVQRLPSKEKIKAEAERGVFNNVTLLTTSHNIECRGCGYRHSPRGTAYYDCGNGALVAPW